MTSVEATATVRSTRELLAWSRSTVQPALRAAVEALPSSMRRIAAYHFGWQDEHGDPVEAAGGKAIRPALTLLSAEAVGGNAESAVPAAVAVELVHNFSLLHDDVMDGDATRRHRPTAWRIFGANDAILAGDALLTLAWEVIAGSGHSAACEQLRMLSAAVFELVDGQSADLAFQERHVVGFDECLGMAAGKSGALLACACALGASSADACPEQVERLHTFGGRLGLAFQIVDDVLGIWGDPAVTGKPVHADLRTRKKTLPVVHALTSGKQAGGELEALYYSETSLSDTDLAHTAELIDTAGAREWSQARVEDLLAQALRQLRSARVIAPAETELDALARLITRRDT